MKKAIIILVIIIIFILILAGIWVLWYPRLSYFIFQAKQSQIQDNSESEIIDIESALPAELTQDPCERCLSEQGKCIIDEEYKSQCTDCIHRCEIQAVGAEIVDECIGQCF